MPASSHLIPQNILNYKCTLKSLHRQAKRKNYLKSVNFLVLQKIASFTKASSDSQQKLF